MRGGEVMKRFFCRNGVLRYGEGGTATASTKGIRCTRY